MCLLFESIACQERELKNIRFHEERMNNSRVGLKLSSKPFSLSEISIPNQVTSGLWKCKVIYGSAINQIIFTPYEPKKPTKFKLIEVDMDYNHKYTDRFDIERIFADKGSYDEIIMVKSGLITDTSIGNLIFLRDRQWFTPDTPLLPGTMRAKLLEEKLITPTKIRPEDLASYDSFMAINALNPFNEERAINISAISG